MSVRNHTTSVTIPISTALSAAFGMDTFSKGIVHLPAAWTTADIGFYVSSTFGGTYTKLSDASGIVVISGPVASGSYLLPTNMMAARFVKLWSNLAGADEVQVAARIMAIDLKT